ncbi:leucine rich repeat LRR-containing protein [Nitzschia inconspicua]|uniref:Leucine rich repeat LRR-containing protein n=1 Tax=Nitzschia inconspicua TaxID=303405 RepID=A0A9K3Q0M1_9STRA|nr:leucine rich repeat LRR-containing protein [Nitzschia inconspicua]
MTNNRLLFEGSESLTNLQKKLETAVDDPNITELEFSDITWDNAAAATTDHNKHENSRTLLVEDANRVFTERPFEKIIIRGGHGQHPRTFQLVRKLCFERLQILPESRLPAMVDTSKLVELSMISMSLSPEIVSSLAEILRSSSAVLQKLDLSDTHLGGIEERMDLVSSLRENRSLRSLSFSECNLRGETLSRILSHLFDHPSIVNIDISYNKPELTSSAIIDLSQLIWNTTTLEYANLGFLAFGSGRQVDLSQLFRCLSDENYNPPLKILEIGGNNLRDEQMLEIVTMLTRNENLQHLDLSNNGFTNDGIQLLSEHLVHIKGIRILDLVENPFDLHGVQMLVDHMDSNTTLIAIKIDEGFSAAPVGRDLGWHLDLNWGGAHKLQSSQVVPDSLWPLILERTNKKAELASALLEREPSVEDVIFHFVRKCSLLPLLSS